MADHTVDVCDDWNGSQGNKVTFVNNTDSPCVITKDSASAWPFKDGPPLPATGSIAPGGTLVTHLKNPLADGPYTYDVSCCDDEVPKTVTVP